MPLGSDADGDLDDQTSAEDVGSLNCQAGILASDEVGSGEGWSLAKGSVWPVAVVVGLVLGEDGSELSFVEDE
jgi:hypothetical protein